MIFLEFGDLFEVVVGDVEDEEAEQDASDRGYYVALAEEESVDRVEQIPHTAPNHNESDHDRKVASKVNEQFCG